MKEEERKNEKTKIDKRKGRFGLGRGDNIIHNA
jgi:hypothetical protein